MLKPPYIRIDIILVMFARAHDRPIALAPERCPNKSQPLSRLHDLALLDQLFADLRAPHECDIERPTGARGRAVEVGFAPDQPQGPARAHVVDRGLSAAMYGASIITVHRSDREAEDGSCACLARP
jgi:hypothetical protein